MGVLRMEIYQLTKAQQRIWYAQEQHKNSSLFNIGGCARIKAKANLSALQKAIEMLSDSFDMLQVRFQYENYEMYQYIEPSLLIVETRGFETEEEFRDWCETDIRVPFVMTNSSLYRFYVFTIGDQEIGYYVKLHHIIADGWSIKLLTEQIAKNYDSITTNHSSENIERFSYLEYSVKENKLRNEHNKAQCTYQNSLITSEDHTVSSTDLRGKWDSYFIDPALKSQIEVYIQKQSLSMNTFFLGIYILTQYIMKKLRSYVIGIPMLGSYGYVERKIFGMFVSTIPVRFIIDPAMSANDFFRSVAVNLKENFKHQKRCSNSIYENTNASGKRSPYNICINYYNTSMPEMIENMPVHNEELYCGEQDYAMQMIIRQWDNNQLQLDFDYQTAVFTSKEISVLFSRLIQTLIGLHNSYFKWV